MINEFCLPPSTQSALSRATHNNFKLVIWGALVS